ncbi:MAG: Cupin domain protein [Syntrophorhabdus sp. PtaB.Bin006]|nr:MAG: Cupin domain protein [Syntrophorhabdus sp. PtaB.Bin006]
MRKLIFAVCFALLLLTNAWAADTHGLAADVLSKTGISWDGRNLPEYGSGKPEITILKISIPAGSELPLHKHSVINAGVLLSGELTVITEDNKILRLKAGESIVEVVNTWHYGKNEGNTPAEIIVFYAGAPGTPITTYKPSPAHSSSSQEGAESTGR